MPLVGGVWLFLRAGRPLGVAVARALRMTLYAVFPLVLIGVLADVVRERFDLDIFPIAPVVVLLFLWWMSAFRGPHGEHQAATMSDRQAEKIMQAYGEALEHRAPAPGCFADSSKLPYPKAQIKEALVAAFRWTADPKAREVLKFGYLQLANWQPGVGESDAGLDMSRIGTLTDPGEQARQITALSAAYDEWAPIVRAEERELEAELRRLNFW